MKVTLLQKWNMMQAIFADEELSQSAKVVAGVLLNHLNTKDLRCDPYVETLEAKCGLKRRSVLSALADLKKRGWLVQKRRWQRSSFYSFPFDREEVQKTAPIDNGEAGSKVQNSAPLKVQKAAPSKVQKTAPQEYGKKNTGKKNTGRDIYPRPISSSKGTTRKAVGPSESEIDAWFEEFWPHYPRRDDKADARKAYGKVIKKGLASPEQLRSGAMRYAAECDDGRERKFIKLPASWLNKGSFHNETPTPAPSQGAQPSAAADYFAQRARGGGGLSHAEGQGSCIETDFEDITDLGDGNGQEQSYRFASR